MPPVTLLFLSIYKWPKRSCARAKGFEGLGRTCRFDVEEDSVERFANPGVRLVVAELRHPSHPLPAPPRYAVFGRICGGTGGRAVPVPDVFHGGRRGAQAHR